MERKFYDYVIKIENQTEHLQPMFFSPDDEQSLLLVNQDNFETLAMITYVEHSVRVICSAFSRVNFCEKVITITLLS